MEMRQAHATTTNWVLIDLLCPTLLRDFPYVPKGQYRLLSEARGTEPSADSSRR